MKARSSPPKYQPQLLRLTDGEKRNGVTLENLERHLRAVAGGNEYTYRRELIVRARYYENQLLAKVRRLRREAQYGDPGAAEQLAELEPLLTEATADCDYLAEFLEQSPPPSDAPRWGMV
jgi:hypothetical protein